MIFLGMSFYAAAQIALFDWAIGSVQGTRFYIRCGLGCALVLFGIARFFIEAPMDQPLLEWTDHVHGLDVAVGALELVLGAVLVLATNLRRRIGLIVTVYFLLLFPTNASVAIEGFVMSDQFVLPYSMNCVIVQFSLVVLTLWGTAGERPGCGKSHSGILYSLLESECRRGRQIQCEGQQ